MNCWFLTDKQAPGAVALGKSELYVRADACPKNIVDDGTALLKNWQILQHDYWESVARSDGGIDGRDIDDTIIPLTFNDLLTDGERFVGVYLATQNIALFFDEPDKGVNISNDEKFVGGWGDITQSRSYYLDKI